MTDRTQYIPRLVPLKAILKQKSHFLLGPRQTGKTSLVLNDLVGIRLYDLLDTSIYLSLSQNPGRLAEELQPEDRFIVIDEIQRLPGLLHEVQRLIEKRRIHFLLTGSSARKLRRGQTDGHQFQEPHLAAGIQGVCGQIAHFVRVDQLLDPLERGSFKFLA